jgi:predicted methyltransferase
MKFACCVAIICNLSIQVVETFCIKSVLSPDWFSWAGCISHHEAQALLELQAKCDFKAQPAYKVTSSIDLSFSQIPLILTEEGVSTHNSKLLATWTEMKDIAKKANCFALYEDGSKPWKVSTLSASTGYAASLCPPLSGASAPTLILAGFTMHRIVGDNINPNVDTKHKLASIFIPPGAKVLDTCMGLGYTAIGAAKLVAKARSPDSQIPSTGEVSPSGHVITCEIDTASLEMAAYNPWSRHLFDDTLPIEIKLGDISQMIRDFPSASFNIILHDPPAKVLCKQNLYSQDFYSQIYRVLKKPGGKLFHYIGNPDSKESGRLFRGVQERLGAAGFRNIAIAREAFGVTATV